MQCEHLHPGTNSQKPAELAWEHVSGSSLVGARRRHHVALLEKVLQISSSDVLFRSTEKRRSTPERSSNHHSKDSRTPSSLHLPAASSRVPGTPLGARRGLPWEVAPLSPVPATAPLHQGPGVSSALAFPLTNVDRMLALVITQESAQKWSPLK